MDTGETLLLKAVGISFGTSELFDLTRLLIKRGADIHQANQRTGETPLLKACLSKRIHLVHILLDAGADVDAPADDNGNSVLTTLADTPEHDQVRRLCEQYINNKPLLK